MARQVGAARRRDPGLTQFFGQIADIEVPDDDELARLFSLMVGGRDAEGLFDPDPGTLLWDLVVQGEEARQTLILSFVKLCVSVTKPLAGKARTDLADLIQAATVSAIVAIDRYDPDAHGNFRLYVRNYARRGAFQESVEADVDIPVAQKVDPIRRKLERVVADMRAEGVSVNTGSVAQRADVAESHVETLWPLLFRTLSLYEPVGGDEGAATVEDTIPDRAEPTPDRVSFDLSRCIDLTLTESEAETVRLFYGIGGEGPMDEQAVADRRGVARKYVVSQLTTARRKLCHPAALTKVIST